MLVAFLGIYWFLVGLLTIRWAITVRWRRARGSG